MTRRLTNPTVAKIKRIPDMKWRSKRQNEGKLVQRNGLAEKSIKASSYI